MASRPAEREIGVRGPFDAYETENSVLERFNEFKYRTGLLDYAHYFRVGAFLARRPFGAKQVEYLKGAHKEDAQSETRPSRSSEEWNVAPSDAHYVKNLRRKHEYDMLSREGNRGRWQIFLRQKWRVHALVLCCSLGAAIQGWDETAINGAQLYYQADLKVQGPGLIGLINSAPYLMCILSCFLTGFLNDYLGRKGTIMVCCVFSFASCLGQAFCKSWQQLFMCRLLLGLGIGPKSATIPIYAAESVPSEEIRGALVMTWQLWTAFGIMLGYAFTYAFRHLEHQWRFMVGSPLVAPAVLFFLMMSLPESPRWHLLKAGRLERQFPPAHRLEIEKHYEHAFFALRTLRHTKVQAARDLFYIDSWLRKTQLPETSHDPREVREGTWFKNTRELCRRPRCRRAMTAGLIVMALQQLCGVNVLAYYSSPVFRDALSNSSIKLHSNERITNNTVVMTLANGTMVNVTSVDAMQDQVALAYSLGFGAINFAVAIPAALLIDKVGRRLLLLTTFPLMSLFQLATGLSLGSVLPITNSRRHIPVVIFAYLFCVAYSIGEGPVPLVYASECLPLEVRDTGVGILTGIYWGLNSLMALTWPSMYQSWKQGSFGFYALLDFIGFFLIVFLVPETSRYTLEELHQVFSQETKQIMETGWAQLKWLITGVGRRGVYHGRWVLDEYPRLVPAAAFSDGQELQDRGGLASGNEATNRTFAPQNNGTTSRRPTNARDPEV